MSLHRRQRRWLSGCLVLVLLFVQFATAAYACPRGRVDEAAPAAIAEMPGCDGHMTATMDPEQPQLCKAHCDQGSQTFNEVSVPNLPVLPVLLAVLDWRQALLAPVQACSRPALASSGAPPPGAPPLYLSLLVLRN